MSNYKQISEPPKWISAHRENIYKFALPQTSISSGYNYNGFLKLNMASVFTYPINVGDRVFINIGTSNPYHGFHIVKEVVSSTQIVLETQWNSNISGSIGMFQVRLPTVDIYKGYKVGEIIVPYLNEQLIPSTLDMSTIYPYTLVARILPEVNMVGQIEFDICGYVKTVIETPYKGAYSYDEQSYLYLQLSGEIFVPKYYNKVELIFEGTKTKTHYVANSSITTDELNRGFVDTGRAMQPLLQGVNYFGQFKIGDYITNNLMKAKFN